MITTCPAGFRQVGCRLFGLLLAAVPVARAIIVFGSGDPGRNTDAPAGAIADSGWQWQGRWTFALGTVIGPNRFVTATHLDDAVGGVFEFRGLPYVTTGETNLPGTDLSVFTVAGRFADAAPLYTAGREIGRPVVVFGRGGRRGEAFEERGWRVGDFDAVQRWGTNTIRSVVPALASAAGDLLEFDFRSDAGADEAIFSGGDSGGGMFLLDRDGRWKLAGIHYAVEGPYAPDTNTAPVFAALFDTRGLYWGFPGGQQFIPDGPRATGGRGFSSRISAHADWLQGQVALPAPADTPVLESAPGPSASFSEEAEYALDPATRTVRTRAGGTARFYRMRGVARVRFVGFEGGLCVLEYGP